MKKQVLMVVGKICVIKKLPSFLGPFIKIRDFILDCFLTTVKEVLKC